MRWVSWLTTAAVGVIVVGGFALWIRSRIPETSIGGGFQTWAMFRDGSRLTKSSPVVIAGVRIGDVTEISVVGQFARVDMRLRDGIQLPADSFITRRADSLFGDSYLEIIPTAGADGAQPTRLLATGTPIEHVLEGASTDETLRAIDRNLPRIDNAMDQLHRAMKNGRRYINGLTDQKVGDVDVWLSQGHIERPMSAARDALERLETLSARGAEAMADLSPELRGQLARADRGAAELGARIAGARADLIAGMRDARGGLDGVDEPLRQATELIAAIERGEGDDASGTLGRLINDPQLAESIEDATAGGREAVSGYNRFRSWLGARIELYMFARSSRFYASAELRGRKDRFYLVEFERGMLGGAPTDQLTDAAGTTSFLRTQEIRDSLRFTAQFGKQIGALSIRGGLKDSTFGVGADLLLLQGRLKLSTDVYGAFERTPRLKVSAALAVFRSIYVLAGVDDALNDPHYLPVRIGNEDVPKYLSEVRAGRDYFLGAALHFDDADLATLLRVYGAVLASAIAF